MKSIKTVGGCALVASVHKSGKQEFIGQGRAIDLGEFVFDATE